MNTNRKFFLLTALALMLGAGLWLTGCESDTVAPHEDPPELTVDDVAFQAGAMGSAAGLILPQIVEFTGTNKTEYTYTFPTNSGDITGTVHFDFRTGGANGASASYDTANWGWMYTQLGAPLSFAVGIGGSVEVKFSIMADIVQATDTATLLEGSGGTFISGDYAAVFAFDGVVVTAGSNYPSGGVMTFTSGAHVLELTYDGDNTASISLNDVPTWIVNLDTGTLTEI